MNFNSVLSIFFFIDIIFIAYVCFNNFLEFHFFVQVQQLLEIQHSKAFHFSFNNNLFLYVSVLKISETTKSEL